MAEFPRYSLAGGNQYPAIATAVPSQYPVIEIVDAAGALVTNLGAGPADGTWIDMVLVNGATAVSGQTPQYMKDSRGTVYTRGQIQTAATGAVWAIPVGYRPPADYYMNWLSSFTPSRAGIATTTTMTVAYTSGGGYVNGAIGDIQGYSWPTS